MQEKDILLTPWKIGNVEIKNRIVLTSMGGTDLFGWMERHHFDKEGAKFIMDVAKNNCGLVLPGCQPVYNPMFGSWLYKNKKMFDDLKVWLEEFHKTGAKLFIQLTAGFGRSFTVSKMMETLYNNKFLRFISKPVMNLDRICASASISPNRWSDRLPSREMTKAEIKEIIEAFAKSAKLCKDAGVDGVEVHAVHEGYLLDQFTLKYVNHRLDNYGGSLENRYRFAAEIVKAIKKECGDDYPVSLRYSVVSKTKGFRMGALPGEEFLEAGRDMQESEKAIKFLEDAGYDMFNCDNGTYDAWYWAHPPVYMPNNCNLEDVMHIKKFTSKPVVCAGKMTLDVGSKAIEEGNLDGIGIARQFLADPEWFTKYLEGRADEIRPCIQCHNGCFNMCHYKGVPNDQALSDSLHLARCAVNAEVMQENKHKIIKAKNPTEVIIIGGGIGGMEAARVLKLRGHKPIIYEAKDHLGGIFVAASAESYKEPLRKLLNWYIKEMERMEIEIHLNTKIESLEEFKDKKVIIATGSTPRIIKSIPGYEKMIEACEYLEGKKEVKQNVCVIGGGLTGCEIAYDLLLKGHNVSIVEMKDDLIKQRGVCLANSSYLREYFYWKRTPVYLETKLKEVKDNKVIAIDEKGKAIEIACDSVISSMGYIPNPLEMKGAILVGDCSSIGNLKTVIWQAYEAAMKI